MERAWMEPFALCRRLAWAEVGTRCWGPLAPESRNHSAELQGCLYGSCLAWDSLNLSTSSTCTCQACQTCPVPAARATSQRSSEGCTMTLEGQRRQVDWPLRNNESLESWVRDTSRWV